MEWGKLGIQSATVVLVSPIVQGLVAAFKMPALTTAYGGISIAGIVGVGAGIVAGSWLGDQLLKK